MEMNTPFLRQLKTDCQNIAKNNGISLASFVKQLMADARNRAPDWLKQKLQD